MNYKYYIADVFTKQLFNGAQVAVFPNADALTDIQMANIAKELNLSETVFLSHKNQSKNSRRMRTFSPQGEKGFAGHPVIAAAFVTASSGDFELTEKYTTLFFEQNGGIIETYVTNNDGQPSFVQFTRQASPIVDYYTPTEHEIANFLGIDAAYIDSKKYSTRLVSCDFPYLVVPVYYYETLRSAKFNLAAWSQSDAPQTAAQEVLLMSPKTPFADTDFSVRLLGPNIGINDDPPVGTAMAAFASYLCSFDHMQKGTYTFAVNRGDEKTRRSVINLEMDHKKEDTLTLRVGGEVVMVVEGIINIPD